MKRTTILLPDDLKRRAEREARARGVSLSELIRASLREVIDARPGAPDPLLADAVVFEGATPPDLAARHDAYLHDDGAEP